MSQKSVNIIDNFKQSCLRDLKSKESNLETIEATFLQSFQTQKEQKIQQLSKVLVNLENEILICLRQKIKQILDIQVQKILNQVLYFQQEIRLMVAEKRNNLKNMIKIIQKDSASSNKLLGKIAEGKIQTQHKNFLQHLQNIKLSPCSLNFDKQEIFLLIEDIQDILHIKYAKKDSIVPQKQSKISQMGQKNNFSNQLKNNSNLAEGNKSKLGVSRLNYFKNQSAVSIFIQEQQNPKQNTIAIDEYKETKTMKKMKKVENQFKRKQVSPGKDVQSIARMALQRKKLLKQME